MRVGRIRSLGVALFTLATLIAVAPMARAATFMPATTSDLTSDLATANSNNQDDTIDLGGNTFTLTSQLDVQSDSGHKLTVTNGTLDGNNATRVIRVESGADLTVDGVTVTNGKLSGSGDQLGAGLDNTGTLTVTASTVSNNSLVSANTTTCGSGIYTNGVLHVTSSTVSGNTGTVTARDVSMAHYGYGGGICSETASGHTTITSSTISGNSTDGQSGAISAQTGSIAITSSTISGNSTTFANGGLGLFDETGSITATTISSNTSPANVPALYVAGTSTISAGASIVAGNSPSDCHSDGTDLTSSGYNVGGSTCPFSATGDTLTSNPKLGALANNGGPTKTQAVLVGSPALNRIPSGSSICTAGATDQRGTSRPQNTGCESGAFEAVEHSLTVTDGGSGSGVVTSAPSGINCGASCSTSFPDGTAVTLTASPDASNRFAGWSGDCSGTSTTCDLTIDADKAATATFNAFSRASIRAKVAKNEGDSGAQAFIFAVTLDRPAVGGETLAFKTIGRTASPGSDFRATSGTLTFAAGKTVAKIVVRVYGDKAVEDNERFWVGIRNPTGLVIAKATGVGLILNDDTPPPCSGVCA